MRGSSRERSLTLVVGIGAAMLLLASSTPWNAAASPGAESSTVVSVDPARILDTRDPTNLGLPGPFVSPVGQKLQVTGSVPTAAGNQVVVPTGATGVLLNVTSVGSTADGFISVRPGNATGAPTTSSLNFTAGAIAPNAVQVILPTAGANSGQIDIVYDAFGSNGPTTDVLVDVVGYTTANVYTKAQVDALIAAIPAGPQGPPGVQGAPGIQGPAGPGVPQHGDACAIGGLAGTIVDGFDERGAVSQKCFRSVVTTLAGDGTNGTTDGTHTEARFNRPFGVAVSADGIIYVADQNGQRIRRITPSGTVTTLAGSTIGFTDGVGTTAQFANPAGVAVAGDGTIYVADYFNHRIRKITPAGAVTTLAGSTSGFADGTGATAQFDRPADVAVADDGTVYVADRRNHRIRKVTPAGAVTTLAGSTLGFADGTGATARFNNPAGVAVAGDGTVYVADLFNHRIRKVTPSGTVTTLAGASVAGFADGAGATARFNNPADVAIAPDGSIYVADFTNNRIRRVTPSGTVTTLAGSTPGFADGTGTTARFNGPVALAVAGDGTIYVSDYTNRRIRRID